MRFGSGGLRQLHMGFRMTPIQVAAPPETTGPEPDWMAATRDEQYRFELVANDASQKSLGWVRGVQDCRLEWSIHAAIRGTGSVNFWTPEKVEWPRFLLRPWQITRVRGVERGTLLGTYLMSAGAGHHGETGVETPVELSDMTAVLAERDITSTVYAPKGSVATAWVRQFLRSLGFVRLRIPHDDFTLPTDMTWDPAATDRSTVLRVVNDVLDVAGHFAISASPNGYLQTTKYTPPGSRYPVFNLSDDPTVRRHRYTGGVQVERSVYGKPNHWLYFSRPQEADSDAPPPPPLRAERINDDPEHPNSTVFTGMRKTERLTDVEAATQAALDAVIDRAKAEAMADQRTFHVDARFIPVTEHEVVELRNANGIQTHATVSARSLDCVAGSPLKLTLREVKLNEPFGHLRWGPSQLKWAGAR